MDVYEFETQDVIRRLLAHRISLAECVASLDAALAGVVPTLTCEQLPRLQALLLANNEIVMEEMERHSRTHVVHPRVANWELAAKAAQSNFRRPPR